MSSKQVTLNIVLPSDVHAKLLVIKNKFSLSNQHEAVAKAIEIAYKQVREECRSLDV